MAGDAVNEAHHVIRRAQACSVSEDELETRTPTTQVRLFAR